ncbi:MAG: InlB B-repeat-containing protein, partial [Thermoplasmatota archaeon]
MKIKEILVCLIIASILVSSLSTISIGAESTDSNPSIGFPGGSGTESDPYLIENWTHLDNVSVNLDSHFELITDIDEYTEGYSEVVDKPDGFDSIGEPDSEFNGTFDGNGFSITGLRINRVDEDYIGLFGYTNSSAEIIDVGLKDVMIKGNTTVGGLVGNNSGTVSHSYITGSIDGWGDKVGGLVGNNSGTVSGSYSTCDVNGSERIGGLVGQSLGGIVEDSYATGDVTGKDYIGGLIGSANEHAEIIQTYYAKGLVELGEAAETNATSGGLIGSGNASVYSSYWDQWSSSQNTSAGGEWLTTEEMRENSSFDSWNFERDNTWNRNDNFNGGYPYLTNSSMYTVNATIDPEGKGWVEWGGEYPYGSRAELVIYPDVGYGVKNVTGCNGSLLANVYSIDSVTENCTLNANLSILQTTTDVRCNPAEYGEEYEKCTELEDIVANYQISEEEIDKGGDCAFIDYRYEGIANISLNGTANASAWLGGFTSETLSEDNHTDVNDTQLNFSRPAQIVLTRDGKNSTIFEFGPKELNNSGYMIRYIEGTFFAKIGDQVHVEIGSLSTCYVESPYFANVSSNASLNMTINPGYSLNYSAQNHGSLEGNDMQYVRIGNNGTPVEAVPDPGYIFAGWSDGLRNNTRKETNVNSTLDVTARFIHEFPEGNGSEQNPYHITNATHLYNVRYMPDGTHFEIQNDLNVSNLSNWEPIGTDSPFVGT